MHSSATLKSEIKNCLEGLGLVRNTKLGAKLIQPRLAEALTAAGFVIDVEDTKEVLRGKIPVWRSKDSKEVVDTLLRRRVDLVAYKDGQLAALIEVESDLKDLRLSGVTRRLGHYDVASIARNGDGAHFDSYNSLERMATAAYCWHQNSVCGRYPSADEVINQLEAIVSDDPADHNPGRLPMFLVSGSCRPIDHLVLQRRLASLDATLICGTVA